MSLTRNPTISNSSNTSVSATNLLLYITAMASDYPSSLQDFFARAAAAGKVVVKGQLSVMRSSPGRTGALQKLTRAQHFIIDGPKFDLDTYTSNYTGYYRILSPRIPFTCSRSS